MTAADIPPPPSIAELNPGEIAVGRLVDADPILAIHRGNDAYIVFGRFVPDPQTNEKVWETVAAIKPDELRGFLPGLAPEIATDSYFSVNGYFRRSPELSAVAFPKASRKETNLRYLNACYADIDCGRPTDPDETKRIPATLAVAIVLEMAERGEIPYPSMLAYSGRGLYAFWMLRDEKDPTKPPRSFSLNRVAFYKAINKALHERMARRMLPVDRPAHDAARVLRVPGSIHNKAGVQVSYTSLIVRNTRNPSGTFTLGELADAVDIHYIIPESSDEQDKKALGYEWPKSRNPNNRKGYQALAKYLVADIEAIFQYQPWKVGKRRRRLSIYAALLKQSGVPQKQAIRSCLELAANCLPSYPNLPADSPSQSVEEIVMEAYRAKRRKFKSEYLANFFEVTHELGMELGLRLIVPNTVRAVRKNEALLNSRKMLRERRLRAIKHYLEKNPTASARIVLRYLTRTGMKSNPQTVNEDMNAMGYRRSPGSAGRPRKKSYPATKE